jgi:membrane-associated protease RseP (regulator of RpoE activity)
MLPAGPFDGGRFFLLAVQSVTGSEVVAKWASRIMGYLILFGFVFIMVIWVFRVVL